MIPPRTRAATAVLVFLALTGLSGVAAPFDLPSRQHIVIVGSSTVFPILSAAAERFSRGGRFRAPVLESTGTGGGFKAFCSGLGLGTPDLVMASRPMKSTEWELCRSHQVGDIGVVKIGYDGIAIASSRDGPELKLSANDLYLALARRTPAPSGKPRLIPNPYQRWRQIHPTLPDIPIRVLGPPPTSGTRDILVEGALERACSQIEFLHQAHREDSAAHASDCRTLREDGRYENAGENDARLVRRLLNDPQAVGILGFNFLDRNRDKLKAAAMDGIEPGVEQIASGLYPLSRPLLLYLKTAHIGTVPGLVEFLDHVTEASGSDGYLIDEGLIPLPDAERAAVGGEPVLGLASGPPQEASTEAAPPADAPSPP